MTAPGRPTGRVRKGAGEAAAVESGTAGAQPKHTRAVFKENAWKRRAEAPSPAPQTGMQLHTADGIRKYLTAGERDAFLREADQADRPVRTLCMTLAYAGCRLFEALALTGSISPPACWCSKASKSDAPGSFALYLYPLPCSTQSTWCTASASCGAGPAKAAACGSGRGRG